MTLAQLAGVVSVSVPTLSKYETGRIVPSVAVVERLAEALGVVGDARLELVGQATALQSELHAWRALHRPSFGRRQAEIEQAEATATTIRLYQPNLVPGLLQTAEYARHVLSGKRVGESIADAVAARVQRQTVLYDESKTFEFVITESALRWRVCPVPVLLAQLDRIASLSTLANVRIGIVPWSADVGQARQTNMFCVFDDSLVLVETMTAELTLREEADIAFYLRAFATLTDVAEYDDGARAILARIAGDLRGLGS